MAKRVQTWHQFKEKMKELETCAVALTHSLDVVLSLRFFLLQLVAETTSAV